jgi:hypothetical protein
VLKTSDRRNGQQAIPNPVGDSDQIFHGGSSFSELASLTGSFWRTWSPFDSRPF